MRNTYTATVKNNAVMTFTADLEDPLATIFLDDEITPFRTADLGDAYGPEFTPEVVAVDLLDDWQFEQSGVPVIYEEERFELICVDNGNVITVPDGYRSNQ